MVSVVPDGTVTSPVILTVPDQISSERKFPDVVLILVSTATVTPSFGVSKIPLLSATRDWILYVPSEGIAQL